ncbi:hypothetical protein ARMSODRAFT_983266 [Armillaria solidipes]|uniref:Uncharacterized protein n=1 Tax=Armillaria solidipes TaxID=1076256 RepID=A0A2H3B5Q6_9AGAR|nr:hypothetical protein ARMSODRAFT_983266 [Armillaria solidipes]
MSLQSRWSPDAPPSNSSPSNVPASCALPLPALATAPEDPHTRIPPYTYPTVVNEGWDLYLQWAYQTFTRSQIQLMDDLVPDMIETWRISNTLTTREFWSFVFTQYEDIYPAQEWERWSIASELLQRTYECNADIKFYMAMEGMRQQGLIRRGRGQGAEN